MLFDGIFGDPVFWETFFQREVLLDCSVNLFAVVVSYGLAVLVGMGVEIHTLGRGTLLVIRAAKLSKVKLAHFAIELGFTSRTAGHTLFQFLWDFRRILF